MVLANNPIPTERKSQIQDRTAVISWDYCENGIADIEADVQEKGLGSTAEIYTKKLEGCSVKSTMSGLTGRCLGSFGYVDPDIEATSALRFHNVYAYTNDSGKDCFYVYYNDAHHFLRDAETTDSNTINSLDGEQIGRYSYFAINNSNADAKTYRYDGNITASVAVTDGGGGKLQFAFSSIVPNNNTTLVVGNSVIISGTTDYDGTYTVTDVTDAVTVKAVGTYVSNQNGTAEMFTMKYLDMTEQLAARLYGYMDDSLVAVGVGAFSKVAEVSRNNNEGLISDFTVSSNYGYGFSIFGIKNEITATEFVLGYCVLSERNRITFHKRKVSAFSDGAGNEQQESRTIEDSLTLSGIGTRSKDGMIVGEDNTLFIADEDSKAIWSYQVGLRTSKKKISESFTPTLRDYDLSNAVLMLDKSRNYLICWVSSIAGGWNDTMLVYNPTTDGWGFDIGKQVTCPVYDPINKKIYGFDVATPRIIEVWDGSFSNLGSKIKMRLRSRPFNAGDEYIQKEYDSSSIKFGAETETQTATINYYIDEDTGADSTETRTMSDLIDDADAKAAAWGQYVSGSGGQLLNKPVKFKRYLNEDAISDFSRLTIEVEEESFAPFLVYKPKLIFIPTDDPSDDF